MATESHDVTVYQQQSSELDIFKLAQQLHQSGYFSDVRSAAQAFVKVQAGREIGIGPVASIREIHIIQGRPTFSANLMAALIKRSGKYDYKIKKLTEEACEIEFYENRQKAGEAGFTVEAAKRAGLWDKNGSLWPKYPKNMVFARALSNGARWYCAEVFNGMTAYTPEEIRELPEIKDVEPLPAETNGQESSPITDQPTQNDDRPFVESSASEEPNTPSQTQIEYQKGYGKYLRMTAEEANVGKVTGPANPTIANWIVAYQKALTAASHSFLSYMDWIAEYQAEQARLTKIATTEKQL